MNYSCNKCPGSHSISLCLQKPENSETKADENNDKKNDINVENLPTENFNTTEFTQIRRTRSATVFRMYTNNLRMRQRQKNPN